MPWSDMFVCLDFFSKTPDGVSEQTAALCYFILVTCVKTLNMILTSGVAFLNSSKGMNVC